MDWITKAKVGDKVELVQDLSAYIDVAKAEGVTLPRAGVVYTIRDMELGILNAAQVFLRVVEIVNGPHPGDGIEASFYAGWFRPVHRRDTDISIFTRMLTPIKEDA